MPGRVIRAGLEAVDRCRPYFIGFIGNCYGRVPAVHYRPWKFGSADHASAALAMYEALYATTQQHDYRKRIEELKGAHGHYSF